MEEKLDPASLDKIFSEHFNEQEQIEEEKLHNGAVRIGDLVITPIAVGEKTAEEALAEFMVSRDREAAMELEAQRQKVFGKIQKYAEKAVPWETFVQKAVPANLEPDFPKLFSELKKAYEAALFSPNMLHAHIIKKAFGWSEGFMGIDDEDEDE